MSSSEMNQNPFWQSVFQALQVHFPKSHEFIYRYLTWNYNLPEKGNYNPDSLPPIGHNAPPPRSRISSNGQLIVPDRKSGGRFGGRSEMRGNSGGRPPRGNDHGRRDGGRGPQRDFGRGQDRDFGRGPRKRGDRPGRPGMDPALREKLEVEAVKAVVDAIDKLNKTPDLQEIHLPPTNSFLRRMQHSEVATHGFRSFSIGEGEERSVIVSRILEDEQGL